MEIRQLEYFVAVAEEANFTRAAERVHISQSGVSAQIRQLERELGTDLIDRSGRAATLTVAGDAALVHAREALASVAAVQRSVDEVTGLIRGRLTVGMVTACTVAPLFEALADLHQARPGVDLELVEDNSDRLVERVRSGSMDLALVGVAGATPADLEALTIISEGLAALVPPHHPLADNAAVTLAELAGYPIVCLPQGTGVRTVFDQECAHHGVHADIALQASAPDTVADLAHRGMGVAVLSETMAAHYHRQLIAIPITGISTPSILALVWRRNQSHALRELVAQCISAFSG